MIFQPAALALLFAASLNALLLGGAGVFALHLLRYWNPASGGERQIALERRTWLVSTLVGLALLVSLPALALFARTADAMAPFFTGAMCAVGSLQANAWGLPALLAQLLLFFLAAAWLIINHLDQLGWDTPLIRRKYLLLLILAPLAVIQAGLLWLYFLNLNPEVITSCCGSLFGPESGGVASDLAALPVDGSRPLFFAALLATLATGGFFLATGRLGTLFGVLSGIQFLVAIAAVVAFIAPYIYEQPNHHCPFCLLQAEHGYAGWLLYPPLFLGTAAGIGVGLATSARGKESLAETAPRVARGLARLALAGLGGFGLAAVVYIARSNLVL
ncbi:MAG: hypothetical protein IPN00_10600 [Hydrogenophilales bacterium]|nr:hypothetical protein [Hydrogenophilales bacterium]